MSMPRVTRFLATAAWFGLGLGACNLPSAALVSMAQEDGAPRPVVQRWPGLHVRFTPGLPLLSAAAEAPLALSRLRGAAARLDLDRLSFGEASVILEGELLHKGMLLPLPAGVLTIRTIAPEAEPAVAVAPIVPGAEAIEAPLVRRQLPEVIGAYSAGRRTLVLATDGSYLMFGPAEPFSNGTFYLVGSQLELKGQGGARIAFAPTGSESWRDGGGTVYTLIHELPLNDEHPNRRPRGSR